MVFYSRNSKEIDEYVSRRFIAHRRTWALFWPTCLIPSVMTFRPTRATCSCGKYWGTPNNKSLDTAYEARRTTGATRRLTGTLV